MDKLLFYEITSGGFTFLKSSSFQDPYPWRLSFVPGEKIFLSIPPWSGKEMSLSMMIDSERDTILYKPNCYKYEMLKKISARALNEMIVYRTEAPKTSLIR